MTRSLFHLAAAVAAFVAATAAVFAAPAVADPAAQTPPTAGSETGPSITWSVGPADADGRDDRSWVERDVDPGEEFTERMAVRNHSDAPVAFRLSAADGYFTGNGRFTMLPGSEESVGAGTWISVPDSVEVGAGATVVVAYTVTVPDDATPGDNAAGIAASVLSTDLDDSGTRVGVESRVGFRVMMRVSGELAPAFDVSAARATFDLSWNPFQPGTIALSYDVQNTGNTRLAISPGADSSGRFDGGVTNGESAAALELLPGDVRRVERVLDGVWPLGLVRVLASADAAMVPGDESAGTVRRELWVWAIPWPQLITASGVVLIVAGIFWRRRTRRAELDRLVAEARRAGIEEAIAARR